MRIPRRKYEIYALYDPPTLMGRAWTRKGALRYARAFWYPTRWWLSYEVREGGAPIETIGNYNTIWAKAFR